MACKPDNIMEFNKSPGAVVQPDHAAMPAQSLEAYSKKGDNGALRHVLSFLAVLITACLVYTGSGVLADSLFAKGFFLNKPRTRHYLEVFYLPLETAYERSPSFKNDFEWCVGRVVRLMPKEKPTFEYADNSGQDEPDDEESKFSAEPQKMSVSFSKLLVKIADPTRPSNLLVSITVVGAGGQAFKAKMTEHDTQLRDLAIGALATNTPADLEKPGARNRIRTELINGFNTVIGANSVQEIYFTEFVVQ